MVAENDKRDSTSVTNTGSESAPSTRSHGPQPSDSAKTVSDPNPADDKNNSQRKRKFDWSNPSRRGGNSNRGSTRGDYRNKKNLTRSDIKNGPRLDKRGRNTEWRDKKRQRTNEDGSTQASYMTIPFSEQEIAAEERKPKRKVAVLIGYAGSGYHGLQINHKEKTIEGDIFAAFVAANAISKANADDPRKSSFVRCARTDKGVHAAGNMLSLKLIIEDPDVVAKINAALPPQIRVWGIERTANSFSCYQACDSRWYEYLMPSYCLLPPHPDSYLGKKIAQSVEEKGSQAEYAERMQGLQDFWAEVEKNDIQPILDSLDENIRDAVLRRLHLAEDTFDENEKKKSSEDNAEIDQTATTEPAQKNITADTSMAGAQAEESTGEKELEKEADNGEDTAEGDEPKVKTIHPVDAALKRIKSAYVAAKRRYRVTPDRMARLQEALDCYKGTRNFHNYTIQKSHNDPSAKRLIKSFVANPEPIQINDTQWISLKVHGQSFMMHQIRKMVGMALLMVRCGSSLSIIDESYGEARISIPKAPSLGLLLERPVFDNYNKKATDSLGREELDFGKYEKELLEFKKTQIYQRMFETEEKQNSFHTFFHQIDSFRSDYFLWVTAGGIEAAKQRMGISELEQAIPKGLEDELGDEGEENPEEGEG